MRRSLLALAVLAASAPGPSRGDDLAPPAGAEAPAAAEPGAPSPAPAAREEPPEPTMTREAALEQAAKAEKDARAAEAAALPLPEAVERQRTEASAALAAHGMKRAVPRWGLALGAGFPEFATASLVFRPLSPVRLHAGPSWNYLGWGLQGGITFVPWSFAVSPLLSLEAGRFFASDLSFVVKGEDGATMKPLLDDVSYSYAAADVGLEVGSQRGLCFTLRLGLSYVSIATHGTATRTESGGGSVAVTNPSMNATLPSLKLGLQYWF
jgi:hypothetical protein